MKLAGIRRQELIGKILMALAFAALGWLGNYLSIKVAFGVNFIFGSIFTIVVAAIMGLWWGFGVSLIASSYTWLLWNHPYAIIIFIAEILWIGFALRKGKSNLLLIDSFYWLVLGAPLVVAFYYGVMRLGVQITAIVALKQALNGIFNALIASILLSHTPLGRRFSARAYPGLPAYATIIFHLTALLLMIPALGILLFTNHREVSAQQERMVERLRDDAQEARAYIDLWVSAHVHAVRAIANMGGKYPLRPSLRLQEELLAVHKLFPDYHNVSLGDAKATMVAFDPPVNERGESTIGLNYADRAWFRQLRETLRPVVSDVFPGRGGVFEPIFTISVPIVAEGRLVRFGHGGVNLAKLHDRLRVFSRDKGQIFSIVDRNGNTVASTDRNRKPLQLFPRAAAGTAVAVSPDVSLWVPGAAENISIMNAWKGAYYYTRQPIEGTNWTLTVEAPVEPIQVSLYDVTIWSMGGVAVFFALSMLLARIVSRRLAKTPEELVRISKDIPHRITEQGSITWPAADTAEMEQLVNNFRDAEGALREQIGEVHRANAALEEKIQERTAELRIERQRLQDIIFGTNVGTWEWNVQTGETCFNERWAEIIGYRLSELEPVSIETWKMHTHPDDLKRSGEILERHFRGEVDRYECEFRMKHKDGQWTWVLDRGKVIARTPDGKPLAMSGTHQDITENKRQEEQNRYLQKAESLHRMAGAVAHHFNNKLGVVLGNLEMAMDESRGNAAARGLTAAMEAAKKAAELSGLMLTYLGFSLDKQERFDLSDACLRVLPVLRAAMPVKAILEADLPVPGPTVLSNEGQIQQILTYLLTNAWEALGNEGGTIPLKVWTAAMKDIPAGNRFPIDWQPQGNDYACLEVADTGCGIARDDIANLFDPFFSSKFTGRGLGLPVVLGIVKTHGGVVTVQSEPGQGSTFRVFLPGSAKKRSPESLSV